MDDLVEDIRIQDATGNSASDNTGSPTGPWNSDDSDLSGFRIDDGSSIPEPNSLVLFGSGPRGIAFFVRRRLKSRQPAS
jgi:hypothetical protein